MNCYFRYISGVIPRGSTVKPRVEIDGRCVLVIVVTLHVIYTDRGHELSMHGRWTGGHYPLSW